MKREDAGEINEFSLFTKSLAENELKELSLKLKDYRLRKDPVDYADNGEFVYLFRKGGSVVLVSQTVLIQLYDEARGRKN